MRAILSQRSDIRIVGDRFVFQSEVLFPKGSAEINVQGSSELEKLALALLEVGSQIPTDINWVLRVDGHTDIDPITNPSAQFQTNWELSSARAIAVVKRLIERGVPPEKTGGGRLRRVPTHRPGHHGRGQGQKPAHRAKTHRTLSTADALTGEAWRPW